MKPANQRYDMPNWQLKTLSVTVLSILTIQAGNASDLEIYKSAASGGATIMMMIDTSGSMDSRSISADYGVGGLDKTGVYCSKSWNRVEPTTEDISVTVYDDTGKATSTTKTYPVTSCTLNKVKYYDRISRLKMALMPMLANPKTAFGEQDISKINIGLGSFYNNDPVNGGKIAYPAKDLKLDNRLAMLDIVKDMKADSWTPSAHAYAEAGAYMMGTTTSVDIPTGNRRTVYREAGYYSSGYYYKCNSNTNITLTGNVYKCNSDYTRYSKNPFYSNVSYDNRTGMYLTMETIDETVNYSGINNGSNTDAISGSKYISPIDTKSTCQGYGIYFLTDGAPNKTVGTSAATMMNKSMDGKITIGDAQQICTSGLTGGESSDAAGWKCIGEYAKALRNTKNPEGTSIVTAAAGFGADFKDIATAGKTGGKYNCDATGLSQDAKNLCKLGEKGYDYGEGGFFYVESPKNLADSVVEFIKGVGNKEIPAISTGTMSVPVDSLNSDQSRGYAYMPILDPKPNQTDLWNGNLKKYYIRNSTITADTAGVIPVFSDRKGNFALNTSDLWNTITDTTRKDTARPDKGQPQVGGTYQQVFENKDNTRNLWVDANGTLTNIKVDSSSKKPIGLTALKPTLRPDLVKPATGTDTVRTPVIKDILNNILVFLGYPSQGGTDMDDTTVLTGAFDKSTKTIGGVLHSIPQLVTYAVDLDADGKFNAATRKDSVLYGSMDGALHLVDDKTGQEQFTFVPKELLELQAGALNKGKTTNEQQPHGVDAPWNVFTNYNFTKSGTTTSYNALQILASGGLRMGGSNYYNLDISNATTPKLVYSAGSNYAKYLQGMTTTIKGMKNGVEGTGDDETAFSRMGQSWGKPSVGYVMSGGKKVMVNFLPGGYDTRYEDATYKPTTTSPAQGNAVYMVKVGEQTIDSTTNKPTITTDTTSGKLLWWATNGTSKDGKTTASNTLQQSTNPNLTNSIITEIRTVDRDYDGLTDHIYFADLGGRVWRADISNNKDTTNFKVDRVVNILDVSDQASGTDAPPRFYERPLLTVTNKVNGKIQGMITVGTGNRSMPVSDKRATADAIYTFMDPDVAKPGLFCYNAENNCTPTASSTTTTLKVSDLAQLKFTADDKTIAASMKDKANNTVTKGVVAKAGWYYPLTEWVDDKGAVTTVSGLKMFNEPDAQAGLLFTSVYNPNINLTGDSCSAGVQGVTERTLMCLPFGNCASLITPSQADYTKRSVLQGGVGIVDNIITQSQPDKSGSLYGVLDTYCKDESCKKNEIIKPSCVPSATDDCKSYAIDTGINRDKLINPRDWWEQ